MSSAASVERAGRDPHALVADLHKRYARRIQRFCQHQLGSREEAEDATQLTFINALRGLERGNSLEHESAWLYTIAQNVCLNLKRATARRRRVEAPHTLEEHEEHGLVERKPFILFGLVDALEALPEPQRRAILLREWRGLSYAEIASELDLSQAAVETLLFRARRSIAAELSGEPKPAGRSRRRDLGSLLATLKGLLFGAAPKLALTAATVAAECVVGASVEAGPASSSRLPSTVPPAAVALWRPAPFTQTSPRERVSERSIAPHANVSRRGLVVGQVPPRVSSRRTSGAIEADAAETTAADTIPHVDPGAAAAAEDFRPPLVPEAVPAQHAAPSPAADTVPDAAAAPPTSGGTDPGQTTQTNAVPTAAAVTTAPARTVVAPQSPSPQAGRPTGRPSGSVETPVQETRGAGDRPGLPTDVGRPTDPGPLAAAQVAADAASAHRAESQPDTRDVAEPADGDPGRSESHGTPSAAADRVPARAAPPAAVGLG
jgi:RNA polymerase sigma factor (sigma-70 family)